MADLVVDDQLGTSPADTLQHRLVPLAHRQRPHHYPRAQGSRTDAPSSASVGLISVARSPASFLSTWIPLPPQSPTVVLMERAPRGCLLIFDNAGDPQVLATPPTHKGTGARHPWLRQVSMGNPSSEFAELGIIRDQK